MKIIHMIPAVGVVAKFRSGDTSRVMAWALYDDGETAPLVMSNEDLYDPRDMEGDFFTHLEEG